MSNFDFFLCFGTNLPYSFLTQLRGSVIFLEVSKHFGSFGIIFLKNGFLLEKSVYNDYPIILIAHK